MKEGIIIVIATATVWFMGYMEGRKETRALPSQQIVIQCSGCNVAK